MEKYKSGVGLGYRPAKDFFSGGVLFSKRMDIIAASQVYRVAGTGYSQLYSLSLMEKLLSRLAPPPQQSGTTLANAGLCLLLLCISLKHTSFYTTSLARSE